MVAGEDDTYVLFRFYKKQDSVRIALGREGRSGHVFPSF